MLTFGTSGTGAGSVMLDIGMPTMGQPVISYDNSSLYAQDVIPAQAGIPNNQYVATDAVTIIEMSDTAPKSTKLISSFWQLFTSGLSEQFDASIAWLAAMTKKDAPTAAQRSLVQLDIAEQRPETIEESAVDSQKIGDVSPAAGQRISTAGWIQSSIAKIKSEIQSPERRALVRAVQSFSSLSDLMKTLGSFESKVKVEVNLTETDLSGIQWLDPSLSATQTRAIASILGTFIDNAYYNYDPNQASAGPHIRITPRVLMNSIVEITILDKSGKRSSNLDEIGNTGEGNPRIASIIQILRRSNFGPLWVKNDQEGTAYRFVISPRQLFWEDQFYDLGIESHWPYFERHLIQGYIVPVASMDTAIGQLLKEVSGVKPSLFKEVLNWSNYLYSFNRFRVLHRLLSGSLGPKNIVAVDNGPGAFPETALIMAESGTRVFVKEAWLERSWTRDRERYNTGVNEAEETIRDRIYRLPIEGTGRSTPAHIAYWTSPRPPGPFPPNVNPETFITDPHKIGRYMGNDVEAGGYLVIQSGYDWYAPHRHGEIMDLRKWEIIFSGEFSLSRSIYDFDMVMPTQFGAELFRVYRRKTNKR